MLAAGLLAQNAVEKGLDSEAVGEDVARAGLEGRDRLPQRRRREAVSRQLGFHLVGYGCTTCIGNSGPLPEPIAKAIEDGKLFVASVLSGNRNFEGRVNPLTRYNYLASPPLVVAYALAGRMDSTSRASRSASAPTGRCSCATSGRRRRKCEDEILRSVKQEHVHDAVRRRLRGRRALAGAPRPDGRDVRVGPRSTYVKNPPYFEGMTMTAARREPITGANALALLGDSITTDHISPAGNIADEPRRQVADRARRARRRTSTRTARAAATTR